MRIFINENIHPLAVEYIKQRAEITDNIEDIYEADAIILRTFQVTRQIMEHAKKLKVIGKHGIGCDSIDLEAARELNIRVVNTPIANVNSVAEFVVGQMIATSRKTLVADRNTKGGVYTKIAPKELTGVELLGKTIGLVGMGNISLRVAYMLKNGFDMKVVGYDPYLKKNDLEIEKYNNLDEMLAVSDYINISVPYTESTRNLINQETISKVKRGAVLVNTSRGGVVNEAALYKALVTGRLRAAASDVFDKEPPQCDNPLLRLDNFIASPHIGANTEEALCRMGITVAEEVFKVLEGKEAKHFVV